MLIYIAILLFGASLLALVALVSFKKKDPFTSIKTMISMGDTEGATLELQKLTEDPDLVGQANRYLGEIYYDMANMPSALECFKKALLAGAFDNEVQEAEIYRKVAEIAKTGGNVREQIEACLEILRILPDDEMANETIGMYALGTENFRIAEPYISRVAELNLDNPELKRALAVTKYECGKKELGFTIMEEASNAEKDNQKVQILYAVMGALVSPEKSRQKINLILDSVEEEDKRILLAHIYIATCVNGGKYKEALDFLKIRLPGLRLMPDNLLSLKYYLLVLLLNEEKFLEASKIFTEIYQSNPDYRQIKSIKLFIDHIDLKPAAESFIPFPDVMRATFDNLVPEGAVYEISGFRREKVVDIMRYFEQAENGFQIRPEYGSLSPEEAAVRLVRFSPDETHDFIKYVTEAYGYAAPEKESSTEKDLFLYKAGSVKDGSHTALFALYKLRETSSIGDIALHNLQNRMSMQRADRAYILTGATFTDGAVKVLADDKTLHAITGNRLSDVMHAFLKSRRN